MGFFSDQMNKAKAAAAKAAAEQAQNAPIPTKPGIIRNKLVNNAAALREARMHLKPADAPPRPPGYERALPDQPTSSNAPVPAEDKTKQIVIVAVVVIVIAVISYVLVKQTKKTK